MKHMIKPTITKATANAVAVMTFPSPATSGRPRHGETQAAGARANIGTVKEPMEDGMTEPKITAAVLGEALTGQMIATAALARALINAGVIEEGALIAQYRAVLDGWIREGHPMVFFAQAEELLSLLTEKEMSRILN
jgi:hypothetical protein